MGTMHRTFCRLCEVGCGVVAEIDDGRGVRVRPDHDHPVTRGFACNKGLLAVEVHNDPARLTEPAHREADGVWRTLGWDAALDGISLRLQAIVDEGGPNAVALYLGNPTAFNAQAGVSAGLFLRLLGSDRLFSAGTQDCSNKFSIGELLLGTAHQHLVPDLDHTDHLLLLGTNPRVSKGSFLTVADPVGRLPSIIERGGVVRFVDPRCIEAKIGEVVSSRSSSSQCFRGYLVCVCVRQAAAYLHLGDSAIRRDRRHVATDRPLRRQIRGAVSYLGWTSHHVLRSVNSAVSPSSAKRMPSRR